MRTDMCESRRRRSAGIVSAALLIGGFGLNVVMAADIERGEVLFEEHCSACHTVIDRVRDKSGPNLHGLFGRRAGSEDYSAGYTDEMEESGFIWTVATLQAFVNSPALMVRGTKMVFRGLSDFDARIDLACYLEQIDSPPDAVQDPSCEE